MLHGAEVIRIHHPRVRPEYAASENVSWHQDCFERKATESQQAQEELSPLLLCLRAGRTFPFEEGAPPCPRARTVVLVIEGEDRTPQSPCSFQFHFFSMNSVHITSNKNWVPFLLLTSLAFVSFPGSCTGRRRQRSSFSL